MQQDNSTFGRMFLSLFNSPLLFQDTNTLLCFIILKLPLKMWISVTIQMSSLIVSNTQLMCAEILNKSRLENLLHIMGDIMLLFLCLDLGESVLFVFNRFSESTLLRNMTEMEEIQVFFIDFDTLFRGRHLESDRSCCFRTKSKTINRTSLERSH